MSVAAHPQLGTFAAAPIAAIRWARLWVLAIWDFLVSGRDVRRAATTLIRRLGRERFLIVCRHIGHVLGGAQFTRQDIGDLIVKAERLSRPEYHITLDRLLELITRAARIRKLLPIQREG